MYSTPLPTTRRQQQQAMQPEQQEPESSEVHVASGILKTATAVQEPAMRMHCAMHVAQSSTGPKQQQPGQMQDLPSMYPVIPVWLHTPIILLYNASHIVACYGLSCRLGA
jgi:hypothetical protein